MSSDRLRVIFSHINGNQELRISVGPVSSETKYEYTLNNPKLTQAQRDFYEHNGFLVIPNLVAHQDLDKYK